MARLLGLPTAKPKPKKTSLSGSEQQVSLKDALRARGGARTFTAATDVEDNFQDKGQRTHDWLNLQAFTSKGLQEVVDRLRQSELLVPLRRPEPPPQQSPTESEEVVGSSEGEVSEWRGAQAQSSRKAPATTSRPATSLRSALQARGGVQREAAAQVEPLQTATAPAAAEAASARGTDAATAAEAVQERQAAVEPHRSESEGGEVNGLPADAPDRVVALVDGRGALESVPEGEAEPEHDEAEAEAGAEAEQEQPPDAEVGPELAEPQICAADGADPPSQEAGELEREEPQRGTVTDNADLPTEEQAGVPEREEPQRGTETEKAEVPIEEQATEGAACALANGETEAIFREFAPPPRSEEEPAPPSAPAAPVPAPVAPASAPTAPAPAPTAPAPAQTAPAPAPAPAAVPAPAAAPAPAPVVVPAPAADPETAAAGQATKPKLVAVAQTTYPVALVTPGTQAPMLAPAPPQTEVIEKELPGKLKKQLEFWGKNSVGFAGPQLGNTRLSKGEAQARLQRLVAAGGDFDEVRRLRKLIAELE